MSYKIQYIQEIKKEELIRKLNNLGFQIVESGIGKENTFWFTASNVDGIKISFHIKGNSLELKLNPSMKSAYLLSGILVVIFLLFNGVIRGFGIGFGPVLLLSISTILISLPIFIRRQLYEAKNYFLLEEIDRQLDEI